MYFTKMNFVNRKHYKQHISGTVIVKLAIKYSYNINGKWYFCRSAKVVSNS